jgi:hypothetical protein
MRQGQLQSGEGFTCVRRLGLLLFTFAYLRFTSVSLLASARRQRMTRGTRDRMSLASCEGPREHTRTRSVLASLTST